jgi:hypothetical protein
MNNPRSLVLPNAREPSSGFPDMRPCRSRDRSLKQNAEMVQSSRANSSAHRSPYSAFSADGLPARYSWQSPMSFICGTSFDCHRDCRHRIAQIDYQRFRADPVDVRADVEYRRDDAKCMKYAARSAIFSIYLFDSELLRDVPILLPKLIAVTDFNRNDNISGTLQRFFAIRRCFNRIAQMMFRE